VVWDTGGSGHGADRRSRAEMHSGADRRSDADIFQATYSRANSAAYYELDSVLVDDVIIILPRLLKSFQERVFSLTD